MSVLAVVAALSTAQGQAWQSFWKRICGVEIGGMQGRQSRRGAQMQRWSAAWLFIAISVLGPLSHGRAQGTDEVSSSGVSYVTPFPPGDIYKLQVYGDGYAEGLLQGLSDVAKSLDRIDLPKKLRSIQQLVRAEAEDEIRAEEQARDVIHIAVVMLGLNDRGSLRVSGGNSIRCCTTAWKEQYGLRYDRLLKALKRRNMAIYVVGMPPLRRQDANADIETINEVLLERAQANGIRFVEVAESFMDENGSFTQFGPDVSGNREKLRDGDGVGFTNAGNRKLASLVANELKRDLAIARAERAVPLAGAEPDQRRINPEKVAAQAWKGIITKDSKEARPVASGGPAPSLAVARAAPGQGDQKVETSRLVLKFIGANGREETASVDIVRPAIPAAVIALLTRKETAEASQPRFEMLADDVGNGISVSTMVAALPDVAGVAGRRRGTASLANYTTVWVKGERLPTKPGRADDFAWPRPDAVALPASLPTATGPANPSARGTPQKSAIPDAQSQFQRTRPLPGAPKG